jgi:serine/threonine protein kinase
MLGIVLYQWLCGFSPFMSDNPTELMLEHVRSTPASLRLRIPSMPAEIDEIVLKALAKNPEQRFPSVKAFADTLDEPLRLAALTQPLQNVSGSVNPYSSQPGVVLPPPF